MNIHPDPDGRVRYAQLWIEGPDGATYYSLPLVAAAKKVRADLSSARRADDILTVPAPLGDRVIPIDRRGGMSVYYAAHPEQTNPTAASDYPCKNADYFCVVSMKDVINGTVPRDLIAGRAIFIGAHSLSAVPDSYPVPNSSGEKMFGVEIWANAAQSILTNRYPVLKQGDVATLAQLFVVTLAGLLLVLRWRLYGFIGALVLLVAYIFGAYVLFSLQTQGLIGSGPVESGCKTVVGQRMKLAGMRWRAYGTDGVCHLRALFKSDRGQWDAFWERKVNKRPINYQRMSR